MTIEDSQNQESLSNKEERCTVVFIFELVSVQEQPKPPDSVSIGCTELIDATTPAHQQGFEAFKDIFRGIDYAFYVGNTVAITFQNGGAYSGTGIYKLKQYTLDANFFPPQYTMRLQEFKSRMKNSKILQLFN